MQHRVEEFCFAKPISLLVTLINYLYLVIIKLTQVWIHRNMTFFADWKRHTLTRFGQLNLHRHLLFFLNSNFTKSFSLFNAFKMQILMLRGHCNSPFIGRY